MVFKDVVLPFNHVTVILFKHLQMVVEFAKLLKTNNIVMLVLVNALAISLLGVNGVSQQLHVALLSRTVTATC
jgi:hypothetical protein